MNARNRGVAQASDQNPLHEKAAKGTPLSSRLSAVMFHALVQEHHICYPLPPKGVPVLRDHESAY